MIDLEVPETVTTPFVVATARPPEDPAAVARSRVRLPPAAELLDRALVRVRTCPAGESGFAGLMAGAARVRPDERRLLDRAGRHIIVTGASPPVSQPGHAQAVREIARVIAGCCDGVVYDGWSHQVLAHGFGSAAEHPDFCLADDWLAVFITGGESLRLVTAGLHRFGFAELEAADVPPGNLHAAVTLLRCLAVGLLAEHWDWLACHPGARRRRLGATAWAEGRDIWRYWAAEPREAGRVRVRLRPAAEDRDDGLAYLDITPPTDFDATAATWWNDVVDLAMPFIPETPRRTHA